MMFRRFFEMRHRRPWQPPRPRRRIDGRGIIARKEAGLELSDPVTGFPKNQIWIVREPALDLKFVKLAIVEGTEFPRPAAQRADEAELRAGEVYDELEPHLPRKREANFHLALHFNERISCREEVRVQTDIAVCGERQVAALVGDFKRTPQDIAAGPDMSRPRNDVSPEVFIGPGLEAFQFALFDKFAAESTESISGRIVAEARPSNVAKRYIVIAGTVAVAALEAEIDRSADRYARKVRVGMPYGSHEPRQNIQRRGGSWVGHQRQIDELLDRTAPKLRPDQPVLALHLLISRMRRPVDPEMTPQVVETDGDGAVAPIESRVHINAQARDGRSFDGVGATL